MLFRVLLKPANNNHFVARHSLLNNVNFRLPEKANLDALIGLRVWWDCWKKYYNRTDPFIPILKQGNFLILDANKSFFEQDKYYYSRLGGKPFGYAAKDQLLGYGMSSFLFFVYMLTLGLFFSLVPTFSKSNRSNKALLNVFFLEDIGLLKLMEEKNIKILHDHVQYENDSNFLYLMLHKIGVTHNKFPSPGPLKTHNQNLICDNLYLNNPYQEEELNIYSETIIFRNSKKIASENTFLFWDVYKKHPIPPKNTLGFYSHGAWLRKKEGHKEDGLNILESEIETLKIIPKIIGQSKGVFLHPKEKKDLRGTKNFYFNYDKAFVFLNEEHSSNALFADIEYGIGAFSTILFERLFCGYKTFFYRSEKDDFPRKDSSIYKISFSNAEELNELINESSGMDEYEFFNHFGLNEYANWTFELENYGWNH